MQGLSAHAHAVVSCLLGQGREHDQAHPEQAEGDVEEEAGAAAAASEEARASEAAAMRRLACACEMVWGGAPGARLLQLEHVAAALVARLHAGLHAGLHGGMVAGSQGTDGAAPGVASASSARRLGCALRCLAHVLLESPGMRGQLAAFVASFGGEAEDEAEAGGAGGASADEGMGQPPPGGQAADARLREVVRARLEARHGALDAAAVVEEARWCFEPHHAARMEAMARRAPDPAAFAGGGIAPSVYSSLCAPPAAHSYPPPPPLTHRPLPATHHPTAHYPTAQLPTTHYPTAHYPLPMCPSPPNPLPTAHCPPPTAHRS